MIAITGGFGFLGWHLACRLRALGHSDVRRIGREGFHHPTLLQQQLSGVDTIFHLAGVNRAGSASEVEDGNLRLARDLASAIRTTGRPVHLVYANSIQARLDNPYGRSKRVGGEILRDAAASVGGTMANVLLPNLFGEHGRPGYNSFVATFCRDVIDGRRPQVTGDRPVPLLHAQGAAAALMSAAGSADSEVTPAGEQHLVSEVLALIMAQHDLYVRGEVPPLADPFHRDLFNTYRSYSFPGPFPLHPPVHGDARGELFETVRSHGGTGQAFVSTTVPGATRGDHYHLRKVERFFVVRGRAEIALRRLYHDDVVRIRLGGEAPGFVDMPTMWVHNITNVGDQELVTMFWADQLLDLDDPDQYPERVETDR